MGRARFLVAYDGAPFHGFAENEGVATVLGSFREALQLVVRRPVHLVGAGRTDAGVHAWGQVISGDLPDDTDLGDVTRRLNKLLGPSIGVRCAEWTADAFDARFSATRPSLPLPHVESSGTQPTARATRRGTFPNHCSCR